MIEAHDLLVETSDPKWLDETLQAFPGGPRMFMVGAPNFVRKDGCYVLRVFGPSDFAKFALENQGYAKVVKELDELV